MAVNVLRIQFVLHYFNFERLCLQVKLSARNASGIKMRKGQVSLPSDRSIRL
ncbi:hypothetical protein SAMN05421781_1511 [Marinococcus luteus]|uniref:Uncharacterized protein n=1 Tax=Marinococcus luteus TaxID=1122204 RepID=A0A1H2TPR3_9BACI|nr:hypothetical protein SAMN05421781_1511 [Marinococcus luteus]